MYFSQAQLVQEPTLDIQISSKACIEKPQHQKDQITNNTDLDLCMNEMKEHIYIHIHRYMEINTVIR